MIITFEQVRYTIDNLPWVMETVANSTAALEIQP